VNVDRRGVAASLVRVRFLGAGLALLAAGCLLLDGNVLHGNFPGGSSHSPNALNRPQGVSAASALATAPSIARNQFALNQFALNQFAPGHLSPDQSSQTQPSTTQPSAARLSAAQARNVLAGLPLIFEPNRGQGNLAAADRRAQFIARGSGYNLFLGSQGATLGLVARASASQAASQFPAQSASKATAPRVEFLEMKLAGANGDATLAAADPLPGVSNYLIGNDPNSWQTGVPQFARVRYENVYRGIDLLFYGDQGHLEYDFQVAPGGDPAQAELEFDGARHVELHEGALVIKTETSSVRLEAPSVYQQIDGRRQPVDGRFVLRGANRAGFAIGAYDHSRELVIDPIISFSSYFGGSGDEHSTSVAVDESGNIYLAGSTTSTNLPVPATVTQGTLSGTQNVYVAKISPPFGSNAAFLSYMTYLGGSGTDTPVGVEVDGAGDAYLAGTTSSANFPTTLTAYQTVPQAGSAGTQHVFVTELNPTATGLIYSTYLSGSGNDIASGMAIDARGNVGVTGTTTSTNPQDYAQGVQFPVTSLPQTLPYQQFPRNALQFFLTEVYTNAPRDGSIAYSTYFGGGNFGTATPIATGGGVAIDANGNIYFSGTTNFSYSGNSPTTDFPILNAYQPCLDASPPVTIVNPETCTASTNSDPDAFVAKINPAAGQGLQLAWSTYFGGVGSDSSTGLAIDSGAAQVFIVGTTNSPGITPVTPIASYQLCLDTPVNPAAGVTACPATFATTPPPTDAYVARFDNLVPSTTNTNLELTYFSYLGGSANDSGIAVTVDASAAGAVMTGWTQSPDFPIAPNPNDIQSTLNGPQNSFVARVNTSPANGQNTVGTWANYYGGNGTDEGTGVAIDVNGAVYFAGDTNSTNLLLDQPLTAAQGGSYNGGYDAFVSKLGSAASLSLSGVLTLGTNQTYISAGNQATFTYTLTNNGPDLATGIVVTDYISQTYTVIPVSFVSATSSSGNCSGGSSSSTVSCSISSLNSGSTVIITVVLTPTASPNGGSARFNGGTVTAAGANNITPAQTSVSATMSDFSLSLNPPNVTVPIAGDTATYYVQLTPQPIYNTNISLSVTGLPNGTTAAFTTNPVTLQGSSPGATTLNITTTARPIPVPETAGLLVRHMYALWLPLPGLALVGFAAAGDRRRRRLFGLFLLCIVFAMLILLPACSHTTTQPPASGTPAGTYPLTITATSGSDSKSQGFQLTVP
jgi:uncharacterized repeat protein (TIGR01451 family)